MTGLAVASFLAFGALLVLFGANGSELIEALSLSYAELGFLGSCLSLGLGVGIVLAGPLVDRLPRRPLYMIACAVVAAACGTLGAGTGFRALAVHTVAIGFGAGFYETVLNALIVEGLGERAPRRLLFVHCAATLAAALTPLLFETLREAMELAWYDTFRITGAAHVLLIAAAPFVPLRDAPGRAAARSTTPATADRASDDRIAFAAICVATFAYVGVETALPLFVGDFVKHGLGLDSARATVTISAFWGGVLVGRLGVALSPREPGPGTTAALAAFAVLVVFSFGLGSVSPPELAMAATGFFLGGVFPVMIGLAGRALPHSAGLAVGLAGGFGSLGGFAVPWLTGRLAESGGLAYAIAALAGWLGLLVASAGFARLRRGIVRA